MFLLRHIRQAFAVLMLTSPMVLAAQAFDPERSTRAFLDSYVSGDATVVQSLIDSKNLIVYGSDTEEFVRGGTGLLRLMMADQQLWHHSATFGPMRKITTVRSHDLITIFFEAPFMLPHAPPVPVRFSLVWHREHGHWLLVQSANTVPTQHQSADELLSSGSNK